MKLALFVILAIQQQILLLTLLACIQKKKRKRRSIWVREIFRNRNRGAHALLDPELRRDKEYYYKYFRMPKSSFDELLKKVKPHIVKKHTHWRTPISAAHRLSITLRYLATGDSFSSLSMLYRVSESSIGRIVPDTCEAIWAVLHNSVLQPPQTQQKWKEIATEFEKQWNFPMCVGSIDGKHVAIQAPGNQGSEFYNYKGFHSIVLLGVCDANYCFTFIDIGDSGRHSDGGVFSNSIIGKNFNSGKLNFPPPEYLPNSNIMSPYCFVGDNAFPLKINLMRPFPERNIPQEQRIFNYRLSRARRCIENTFGIMAQKWRVYRKVIMANENKAVSFVKATVCLHNWLRKKEMSRHPSSWQYCSPSDVDREDRHGNLIAGSWRTDNVANSNMGPITKAGSNFYTSSAREVRQHFLEYFNSSIGEVSWQYDVVNRGR